MHETPQLTAPLTAFFACAVGIIIINLAAAQPLTGPIAAALHLPAALAGLVATLPQLGYAVGMIFVVPLADLLENRILTVATVMLCALMLLCAAVAPSASGFLGAVCLAGSMSCAIQILVPLAAALAHPQRRGSAVGNVMSGVMIGILASRPLASLVAGSFGWRAFYALMAVLNGLLAVALRHWLPVRRPASRESYGTLIGSLLTLWLREPVLRRYTWSAAACMAIFSAFWTGVALRLVQAPFSLSDTGLAVFALSGVTGTVIAPIAGRLGDRGHTVSGMRSAHWALVLGCVLAGVGAAGWFGFEPRLHRVLAMGFLVASAIVLDAGVVCDQTLGRRAINMLDPAVRSRLNGLFVGVFFVGGAVGAAAAGAAWAAHGWTGVCITCLGFSALTFVGDVLQVPSREFRPTAA